MAPVATPSNPLPDESYQVPSLTGHALKSLVVIPEGNYSATQPTGIRVTLSINNSVATEVEEKLE